MTTSPTSDTTSPRPLAVVTGASSGIGRALAQQFADHDFDLVVVAEDDALQAAADELEHTGAQVRAVQVDLATPDGVEKLHEVLRDDGRPVAAAALNAGVGVSGRFHETDLAAHLRLVDLNVRSTVHLAGILIPGMVQRGEGRLLFTASVAATVPGPYYATYAASKSFVHSMAQGIRHELADTGVTVTSLMPGPTETDFFERAGMTDTKVGASDKDDATDVARDGYEALMAGKDHVVAGSWQNTAQVVGARVLPDTAGAAVHARMTQPDSAER